jgi:hypothetical protein
MIKFYLGGIFMEDLIERIEECERILEDLLVRL